MKQSNNNHSCNPRNILDTAWAHVSSVIAILTYMDVILFLDDTYSSVISLDLEISCQGDRPMLQFSDISIEKFKRSDFLFCKLFTLLHLILKTI